MGGLSAPDPRTPASAAAPASASARDQSSGTGGAGPYSVRAIALGRTQVPGPEVCWMSDFGTWRELVFWAVLVRGSGRTILVNTGPPADLGPLNAAWVTALGPRAAFHRGPSEELLPALAAAGVSPGDVTDVVLTPLQLYTTGNLTAFPNARIHLSRRGWVHFHTTHAHPHDVRWLSLAPETLVHLVTDAWERVHLLADADEIAPGVRSWFAGVHHRASICLEVDTPDGVVAISDAFFTFANIERDQPIGILESLAEAQQTYARVRATARHLLPLYDPEVARRYPGGWVR